MPGHTPPRSRRPRTIGGVAGIGAILFGVVPHPVSAQVQRATFESVHMGTTFRIEVYTAHLETAQRAATAAFARIAQLDSLFSDYRPDSELSVLTASYEPGRQQPVSPELWAVLTEAQTWARATEGAFDVTAGPLTRLWRWSARRGQLPEPDRIERALTAVGFEHLRVHPTTPIVALTVPGMALDLGGIAKGFAADEALTVLKTFGIRSALVDAGGDLAIGEPPPGRSGWLVSLLDGDTIRLARAAVATSSDRERHVVIEGVRYGHIVDPATGLGRTDTPSVTVIAPTATRADALASALSILERTRGEALVRQLSGTWARVSGPRSWTASGPEPAAPLIPHHFEKDPS